MGFGRRIRDRGRSPSGCAVGVPHQPASGIAGEVGHLDRHHINVAVVEAGIGSATKPSSRRSALAGNRQGGCWQDFSAGAGKEMLAAGCVQAHSFFHRVSRGSRGEANASARSLPRMETSGTLRPRVPSTASESAPLGRSPRRRRRTAPDSEQCRESRTSLSSRIQPHHRDIEIRRIRRRDAASGAVRARVRRQRAAGSGSPCLAGQRPERQAVAQSGRSPAL